MPPIDPLNYIYCEMPEGTVVNSTPITYTTSPTFSDTSPTITLHDPAFDYTPIMEFPATVATFDGTYTANNGEEPGALIRRWLGETGIPEQNDGWHIEPYDPLDWPLDVRPPSGTTPNGIIRSPDGTYRLVDSLNIVLKREPQEGAPPDEEISMEELFDFDEK